ncbi:MAG: hypothetical protein M1821_004793 [Bathelium mastoideum]|nr:MAG: hypothetical protein M1821_004793 [Bathelium mastoideum]
MTLVFMCSEHLRRGDSLEGPAGIMRSLCTQLLLGFSGNLDLSFVDNELYRAVRNLQTAALCRIFNELLTRAAKWAGRLVVFCMIDDFAQLEDRQDLSELQLVIRNLFDLVQYTNAHGVPLLLKVLAINSSTSMFASKWVGEDAVLDMPPEVLEMEEGYDEFQMATDSAEVFQSF